MDSLEKAGYLAHARSASFVRRVNHAQRLIDDHSGYTACVSWGKDSVVLYHLCGDIPAVHGRYREEERLPDLDNVRDAYGPGEHYREVYTPGAWDMFERGGGFFFEPETPEQKEAYRWYHAEWERAMLEGAGENVLLGIRRDESANRDRLVAMRGESYETKTQRVALPLSRWSSRDIWAYIISNELPYPHIYDVGFAGRGRERSDMTFGAGGASRSIYRHGAWESWRRAYPEHFARWLEHFPEMREFV